MMTGNFQYSEFGPVQGDCNDPQKLVLLLHGYGVNAGYMDKMAVLLEQTMPDAKILNLDAPLRMETPDPEDHEGLAVPLPEEAYSAPEGLDRNRQLVWFPISENTEEIHDSALSIASALNNFIDQKCEEYNVENSNVGLMGFSQGGAVALYAACTRESEIGCVVGHSALVMGTDGFVSDPSCLLIYGEDDPLFSINDHQGKNIELLSSYLSDFQIESVAGLEHKTNQLSREMVASYMADRM